MQPADSQSEPRQSCRRGGCSQPVVGRGLCAEHYGRWHAEIDPDSMPGDTAPAPERTLWQPPAT